MRKYFFALIFLSFTCFGQSWQWQIMCGVGTGNIRTKTENLHATEANFSPIYKDEYFYPGINFNCQIKRRKSFVFDLKYNLGYHPQHGLIGISHFGLGYCFSKEKMNLIFSSGPAYSHFEFFLFDNRYDPSVKKTDQWYLKKGFNFFSFNFLLNFKTKIGHVGLGSQIIPFYDYAEFDSRGRFNGPNLPYFSIWLNYLPKPFKTKDEVNPKIE